MRALDLVVALFAAFMLVRHGARAVAFLRGRAGNRAMAMVSFLNVALAIALLAFALKGLFGRLVSR